MAQDGDAENQATAHEQTPLLEDHHPLDPDQEPDQIDDEPKQTRKVGWYVWRILWVIVAALILAVFITSWIAAGGDVDVGVTI